MKNRKDTLIFIVVIAAALWTAFIFFKPHPREAPVSGIVTTPEEPLPSAPVMSEVDLSTATMPTATMATPSGHANFGERLKEIGECLEIGNTLDLSAQPNIADLQTSLRSSLGDLQSTSLEWKNVHLTMPSGERRRVRIEIDIDDSQTLNRHLQYYTLNGDGLTIPIPLTPEQEHNPTDTFIAGLESDGEISLREDAHRGYYSQGVELYYVEKNGALSEIEMNYQGKSVRCQNLENQQNNCQCF